MLLYIMEYRGVEYRRYTRLEDLLQNCALSGKREHSVLH